MNHDAGSAIKREIERDDDMGHYWLSFSFMVVSDEREQRSSARTSCVELQVRCIYGVNS